MKIFNLIFSLLFLVFAILQFNDPDPYIWIPIYLFGAILCWLAFRRKYFNKLYLGGMFLLSAYALRLFFKKDGVMDWLTLYDAESILQSMKTDKPWIETTREFLGLFILIIVLSINYVFSPRKKPIDY